MPGLPTLATPTEGPPTGARGEPLPAPARRAVLRAGAALGARGRGGDARLRLLDRDAAPARPRLPLGAPRARPARVLRGEVGPEPRHPRAAGAGGIRIRHR